MDRGVRCCNARCKCPSFKQGTGFGAWSDGIQAVIEAVIEAAIEALDFDVSTPDLTPAHHVQQPISGLVS
jgi:hypothetical protein